MHELRGVLVAATAALALAGCGLIGGPVERGEETTTPPGTPAPPSSSGSPGYEVSCTGDGELQARSSIQESYTDDPAPDGADLAVSLGWTTPGDDGDGTAALYLMAFREGAEQPRFEDLHVGDVVTHDAWTVTVRSVCDGRVGMDIEPA